MQDDIYSDKPTFETYADWYANTFLENLMSGRAERWHESVTSRGLEVLEESEFWQQLQQNLPDWNVDFRARHKDYPLLALDQQPKRIQKKGFDSTLNKAFRWNIVDNGNWPGAPDNRPSTASAMAEPEPDDPRLWFGPSNWLADFPDIFRVRLTTTYFDGVRFLADKVNKLAEETTVVAPKMEFKASLEGYHAVHVLSHHDLDILEYETMDPVTVRVSLEVQVVTTIQDTIIDMLHRVYEDWRLNGTPSDWEWDYQNPAFSVNYLGSTLHYLEGMIVLARDQERNR